jgi:hypothetical protein
MSVPIFRLFCRQYGGAQCKASASCGSERSGWKRTPVIPAGIEGDGRVDIRDLCIVCRLYGATQGSENWNPRADVMQDGVIDMRDVGFVVRCFLFSSQVWRLVLFLDAEVGAF